MFNKKYKKKEKLCCLNTLVSLSFWSIHYEALFQKMLYVHMDFVQSTKHRSKAQIMKLILGNRISLVQDHVLLT